MGGEVEGKSEISRIQSKARTEEMQHWSRAVNLRSAVGLNKYG